ncbi:MAG: hypothetical protein M3O71_05890 [Bacteroidota bacterium]|nr:hypothetical protein [Bacteroidota bacterium]
MKPKILLRIAAIMMFLHTIGHTLGAFSWDEAPDAAVGKVIYGMKIVHFAFMGRQVTLASFYIGYGFTMILVLLPISILLWLLSTDAGSRLFTRLVPLLGVFLVMMAVIEYVYFFPFAAAFSFLAGICTLIAFFIREPKQNQHKQLIADL